MSRLWKCWWLTVTQQQNLAAESRLRQHICMFKTCPVEMMCCMLYAGKIIKQKVWSLRQQHGRWYACHVSRLRCVSKLTCDSKEWICIQDWIAQIADLSSYQNCCLQTCIHSLIHLFVQYVWILPHNWVHTGLLPADEQILCANGMKSKSKP